MAQEHRFERRMGDWTSTGRQFGQKYFSEQMGRPEYPRSNPNNEPPQMDYARLPKKPKPTRPVAGARTK